jgi:hypothetical protein
MAIDVQCENLIHVKDTPKFTPGRPHKSTVYRWVFNGDLETVRVGGRLFTSTEAIGRFIVRCTNKDAQPIPSPSLRRQREIRDANKKLDALGV